MADDEVGGGEVGLGVAVGNQVVMRPGLNLAGRRGGAELAALGEDTVAVPTRITLSTGAFLTRGGEHIGGNDLMAGAGYQNVVSSTPFSPSVSTFLPGPWAGSRSPCALH